MKEFRSFIQTVSRMDYTFPDDMKQVKKIPKYSYFSYSLPCIIILHLLD